MLRSATAQFSRNGLCSLDLFIGPLPWESLLDNFCYPPLNAFAENSPKPGVRRGRCQNLARKTDDTKGTGKPIRELKTSLPTQDDRQ
mmetsp:Transcript_21767/g.34105  ORF Transcript_21767/g.34105 Transcript_21767/m.34105 type:complete len:87 (+) Transcript_21767:1044-1304(+)